MYTNCSRLLFPMFDLIFKKTAEYSKTFGVLVSFGVFTTSSSAYTTSSSSSSSSSSSFHRRTFDACPEIACSESKTFTSREGGNIFDEDSKKRRRVISHSNSEITEDNTREVSSECPDNRESLGLHTWHFLHSVAAYYPNKATNEDKMAALGLLFGVAHLYPCSHCRSAFAADMEANPPTLDSRDEFSVWLCKRHNTVNEFLGKPTYPCIATKLNERWRSGGNHCTQLIDNNNDGSTIS